MKEFIKYNDKEFTISAYNINVERNLLLTAASDEDTLENVGKLNLNIYLRELEHLIDANINIYNLSEDEKLFLIYKLRGISVSNEISLNTRCSCDFKFKCKININNILNKGDINHPELKNIYSEDIREYFKCSVDDLEIEKYDELEDYILENKTTFNFLMSYECPSCKNIIKVNLKNPEIYKNCFSENNIVEFYKGVTRLSFTGKFTINGILNDLYPFERDIFMNLINAEVEEYNKNNKKL